MAITKEIEKLLVTEDLQYGDLLSDGKNNIRAHDNKFKMIANKLNEVIDRVNALSKEK